MNTLFIILAVASVIALVIGLIKPKTVIRWGKEEKKTRKQVLLVYGIGFILFLILASATKNTSGKGDGKSSSNKEATAEKSEYKKIGEEMQSGDFIYRISKVERVSKIKGTFHVYTSNYVIVTIDLSNPTKKTEKVDIYGTGMKILTEDGYEYKHIRELEITQSLNPNSGYNFIGNFAELQPETYTTAKFAFEIPKDKKGLVLHFRCCTFGSDLKVKLD